MKQQISAKMILGILVLIALVVFVLLLSIWAIKAVFYIPQTVNITRVEMLCSVNKSKTYSRVWTWDCQGLQNRAGLNGFVKDVFVSFAYTSPANGQIYRGMLERSLNDEGKPIQVGDRITVDASRLVPETYTDWWNANITNDELAPDTKR